MVEGRAPRAEGAEASSGALKGRLADVYVAALVSGSLTALARRLGNRATVDDPRFGRASSLASIDPMTAKASTWLRDAHATYRHVATTSGVDRDLSEGVVSLDVGGTIREMPIAVVAERRRLREIELRLYYSAPADPMTEPPGSETPAVPRPGWPPRGGARGASLAPASRSTGDESRPVSLLREPLVPSANVVIPQLVAHTLEALKRGAVERVLSGFEEHSRLVDPEGRVHVKRDGTMARFLDALGAVELAPAGMADDGRTCCLEMTVARGGREATTGVIAMERGDSGLIREVRLYYET